MKRRQKFTDITEQMRKLSHEKAIFRKAAPKDPLTGEWRRVLNRVVEPYQTQRDRSLRGKVRISARRAENRAATA